MSNLTTNLNYLTPSNFKLTIDNEYYANTQFFVHSFDHPSASVSFTTHHSPRVPIPLMGDKLTYGDLQITLLVDENMISYKELYAWLLASVNQNLISDKLSTRGKIPSFVDMTLSVLSSKNNVTTKIKYKNCILTDIGELPFDTINSEGQLTFTATFKFSDFDME